MTELTASELAERLGVTKRRALELLRTQIISGHQLANGTWLADGASVVRYQLSAPKGSGRTLDGATAWGLLWELSGLRADWLSASTYARVRRRIRERTPADIVALVSSRTKPHYFTAANVERASKGLIKTGRAASDQISSDLLSDTRHVCGYVRSGNVTEYARSNFMIARPTGLDVIYDNTLPFEYEGERMPPAVIAADLANSTDTRERSAGLSALTKLRDQWLAAH